MSGGTDISCLRGFRTPCCFFGALLVFLTLGLLGYGVWVGVGYVWDRVTDEPGVEGSATPR